MKHFLISSWWSEGTFVDLWSVNHLLSGVIAASACVWLAYNFWPGAFITFGLMVLWELFEFWHDSIFEHMPNILMDIVIGMLGFILTYYLLQTYASTQTTLTILISATVIAIILVCIGYINFVARTPGEKHPIPLSTSFESKEHDTIDP